MEGDQQSHRSPKDKARRLGHISAVRLNRFIAATGITSRRGADELIDAGRVTVNGKACRDFHYQPLPTDHVKVNGKLIRQAQRIYLVLHKPAGFVSTRSDPHVTQTIYDLLPPQFSSLSYVGRLDAQTEGLMLLTNDGDLVERLTHPRFKVEKEYQVVLDQPATPELLQRLRRGVVLDGKRARMKSVDQTGVNRLRVVLEQGINRQIRRMVARSGIEVAQLRRVRFGQLKLGQLPRGEWRQLRLSELHLVNS